jgi:rhamnosyltransferase
VISVIIPVKDGGEDFRLCLEAIKRQRVEDEVELVVVDSGSRDGSDELAQRAGARVERIPPEEFNHGGTRNLGARLARGDVLVFTSQDAHAADDSWLAKLTAPVRDDPRIAGVYGRQVPHDDAPPPEQYFMDFLYGPDARRQEAHDRSELSMETTLFSNANAAIKRSVFDNHPFVEDIIMSEDQEWAQRVLLDGWELLYLPDAAVRHSHPYTITQAFRRFFDSGVSAERAYLAGARPAQLVLRQQAVRYARGELRWLWRSGHRRWLPYAIVYELAKFIGLQLGIRHRHLPLWLKRRCTAFPAYWASANGRGAAQV